MEAQIVINEISEDIIEILGKTYYSESYLNEMMRREYARGYNKAVNIHILEIQEMHDIEK